MQRVFIFNPYNSESEGEIENLPSDFLILNAFSDDIKKFIHDAEIPYLPYTIDKEIELITNPPFLAGEITLEFYCKDYRGVLVQENEIFNVTIGNEFQRIQSNLGILEVKLKQLTPELIPIKIIRDGYMPLIKEVKIETPQENVLLPVDPEILKFLPDAMKSRMG